MPSISTKPQYAIALTEEALPAGYLFLLRIATPRSLPFVEAAQSDELGDGNVLISGVGLAVWYWEFLEKADRDILRAFCTGYSSELFIRTLDQNNEWKNMRVIMTWPTKGEDWSNDFSMKLTVTFKVLEVLDGVYLSVMTKARELSFDELAAMSSPKQRSQLFLAGLENPAIIFSGQVNQTFATHDMVMQFAYDNVVDGVYTDIEPNMLIWFGTAIGKSDLGFGRAARHNPTDTIIYINETSEIRVADNIFFTVVNDMIPMPRHARIFNKTVYMDGDVAYSDQNVNFAPVPIFGCDAVVDVQTYPVEVKFPNIEDSWVFDGEITDYLLEAEAGVVTDAATTDPTLTLDSYPLNGRVRVRLTITADNGKSMSGYRYVHVYDALHRPRTVFNLSACKGDFDSGCWSFEVTVFSDAGVSTIRNRAPVILFAKDWYGNAKVSHGQLTHRENIVCMGWIAGESIQAVPNKSGYVKFRVEGLGYWLSKIPGYPPGRRLAKNTPTNWRDVKGLTVARGVYSLLHWHTTVMTRFDVYLTDDERYATAFDVPAENIWEQIKTIAGTSILANAGSDRFGRLFCEIDPQLTPVAERGAWPTVMNITKANWKGKLDLRRRVMDSAAQFDVSGMHVDASGNGTAYLALSNGHVYKTYGTPNVSDMLLVRGQAHVQELAGLMMGLQNMEFEPYEIELAANNRMVDVFPRMDANIVIEEADTIRGVAYTGKIVFRSVGFEWNSESMVLSTVIEVENASVPEPAVKGDIPEDTGVGKLDFSIPKMPAFNMPPMPMFLLPPDVLNPNLPKEVLLASSNFGFCFTKTFNAESPLSVLWATMNAGLTAFEYESIAHVIVTPSGAMFALCSGDSTTGWDKVIAASALGGAWTTVFENTEYAQEGSQIWGIGYNPLKSEEVAIWGGRAWSWSTDGNIGHFDFMMGGRAGFTIKGGVDYSHRGYASIIFTNNGWNVFANQGTSILGSVATSQTVRFTAAGVLEYGNNNTGAGGTGQSYAISAGTQDKCYFWDQAVNTVQAVTINGTIYAAQSLTAAQSVQGVASSPTGTHLMGAGGYPHTPYKSTDGGATWLSAAATTPIGADIWENCKDDNRFIRAGGTAMFVTLDHGLTWIDRSGNLGYITPLIDITNVRYIR